MHPDTDDDNGPAFLDDERSNLKLVPIERYSRFTQRGKVTNNLTHDRAGLNQHKGATSSTRDIAFVAFAEGDGLVGPHQDGRHANKRGCSPFNRSVIFGLVFISLLLASIAGSIVLMINFVKSHSNGTNGTNSTHNDTVSNNKTISGVTVWQVFHGNEGFGSKVAIVENSVAICCTSSASVITYHQQISSFWRAVEIPTGGSSLLGADIALAFNSSLSRDGDPFLLVGVPNYIDGSAFLYKFNQTSRAWSLLGSPLQIQGKEQTLPAFGSAVVLSDSLRAVVGAPTNGGGLVFTFQFKYISRARYNWTVSTAPLVGRTSQFGSVMAMTTDGSFLAVGEPDLNSFTIYSWQQGSWLVAFTFQPNTNETGNTGSSLAFLSTNLLAVGNPSANEGAGMVSLFQLDNNTTSWTNVISLYGSEPGELLGSKGTVSGSLHGTELRLAVSTAKGIIRRYDLLNSTFIKRSTVDMGAAVTSIATQVADTGGLVILGGYGRVGMTVLYGPSSSSRNR